MVAAKKGSNKADAAKALEAAKAKFAEANKKLQEKRQEVSKARRTIATGNKRIDTLEKKIEETKDAPSKAAELLLKKAEEMEKKALEIEAEQDKILKEAAEIESNLEKKQAELDEVKKKSDEELEAMGIPKVSTRTPATGTTAERRAKNNFQYRLKSKEWNLTYNTKGRIESAEKYGLEVVFNDDGFTVTGNKMEAFTHPYGEGSLTALANVVKEHGKE